MKNKAHLFPWIQAVLVLLLLLFFILIYFKTPTMTTDQRSIARFLMAILGGFATFFIGGSVILQMRLPLSDHARVIFSATAGIAIFALLYLVAPYWYEGETAKDRGKDLTGHSSLPPKPAESLKITLLQSRDGKPQVIPEESIFHRNDKLRFRVESPHDGFLYLLQCGSSGQFSVLIPDERIRNGEHRVQGGEPFLYPPADGRYEFNEPPGVETIYAFTAREKTNPLAAAIERSIARNHRDSLGQALLDDEAVRVLQTAAIPGDGKPIAVKIVKLTHER